MQYSSSSSLKFAAMELPWKLDYAATSKTAPPPLYLIFNIFQVLQNQDKGQSATQIQDHHKTGSLSFIHDLMRGLQKVGRHWIQGLDYNFRDSKIQSSTNTPLPSLHKCTAQALRPPVTLLMSELLWRWITHLARVLDIDKGGRGALVVDCWLVTIVHLVSRDLVKKCNYYNTKQET